MLNEETLKAIAENPNFEDKQLLTEITELFKDKPEAIQFLHLYGEYCEVMDDLVDEVVYTEMVDKAGQLRMQIGQCPYWQMHNKHLWVVEQLIHNTYFDSVKWEDSKEEWQRRDAKALSHCAYNMLFAVILLEFGADVLNKISLRFREHAHKRHLHDTV